MADHLHKSSNGRHRNSEQALRLAVERIRQGNPQNPKLAARRSVKLSVNTVALESGLSRTAIYKHHPRIIDLIRQTPQDKERKMPPSRRSELQLRSRVRELESLLADALSMQAMYLAKLEAAEERERRKEQGKVVALGSRSHR